MKFYIDKDCRNNCYFILCLLFLFPVACIVCVVASLQASRWFAMCLTGTIAYILLGPFILFALRRRSLCVNVKLEEKQILSTHLLGNIMCKVDLNKPTYCSAFRAEMKNNDPNSQERYVTKKFCAVSNQYFNVGSTANAGNDFLKSYDYRRVIVFAWDERVDSLMGSTELIDVSMQ